MYWNTSYNEKVPKKDEDVVVHEISSEAHIVGGAEFYGENILVGSIADKQISAPFYHQVKLRFNRNTDYSVATATTKGYYHPDGVAGEFTALMSLCFRTRFYHVSTVGGELSSKGIQWRENNTFLRVVPPTYIDSFVFGKQERSYLDFQVFMEKIATIPEEYHRSIISAASNYNLALREIGIDHEMVFVRLVSAIEAFSTDFVLNTKDDPLSSQSVHEILENFSGEIRSELELSLQARKSRLKFTRFLETYSKGYFKGGNHSAKHTKIKKAQLGQVSKTIYAARSKYLHSGERMYLSQAFAGTKYDTDPSSAMYMGGRKFLGKDKLPNIEFFEGLVRHCILQKINELASS